MLKFFFRRIDAVNGRSRLLPPRFSDCSGINRIEGDPINELSDCFFRLGIVTGNRKSNTISASVEASRPCQRLRPNRIEDLDDGPPNLLLNPRTVRKSTFYLVDTSVAPRIIVATSITMVSFFALFRSPLGSTGNA